MAMPDNKVRQHNRYITLVIVALTGVIAVAAIIAWNSHVRVPRPPKSQTTLAQDVLKTARGAISLGQNVQARDLMLAYVRTHPDDVEVRPLLARTHWNLGNLREA